MGSADDLRRAIAVMSDPARAATLTISHPGSVGRLPNGRRSFVAGWTSLSDEATAILRALKAAAGEQPPFDWIAWRGRDGHGLDEPDRIATASRDDLSKLLLAVERADRFNEGLIASWFRNGRFLLIAQRLLALDGLPGNPPT